MVKAAIGKEQGDLNPFRGETIGVFLVIAFDQPVRFHFAQIIAQLIEAIVLWRQLKRRQHRFMDLLGRPAGNARSGM